MNENLKSKMEIAYKVRSACMIAAEEAFQDAAMSGLCMEGAVEAAVGAIESLNLKKMVEESTKS